LLNEFRNGAASTATADMRARPAQLSDDEIRERMSGNICRCGAYANIVAAVRAVHDGGSQTGSAGMHNAIGVGAIGDGRGDELRDGRASHGIA
jgi:xanthine dehydrogenase YagT iron-sulfur-binding subunit